MSDVPDRTRTTDPATPMSDHDILLDLAEKFSQMASDIREIAKETSGTARAFHSVNQHLTSIATDVYLASEQMVPLGTRVGELEARVMKLESRRASAFPPPGEVT